MGYFSLRCFEPKIGRYVIIVLNVIVGLWGITHWAYAGIMGQFKKLMLDNLGTSNTFQGIAKCYDSLIAYFAISGIIQVIASALVILLIFGVMGKDRQLLWVRGIMILLMIEFAFSFFIAVYSSLMSSFWDSMFKDQMTKAINFLDTYVGKDFGLKSYYITLLNFMRFNTAEAVITWIVALPSIIVILISLTDQLVTQENVYKIIHENPQTVVKNNVQINPIPQNSLVDINMHKK